MYVCTAGKNTQTFPSLEALAHALTAGFRHDYVEIQLPIAQPVTGRVTRYPGQTHTELVHLHVNGVAVAQLPRGRGEEVVGSIGVSCSPDGAEALVQSINISFRPSDDILTDRGVVWVLPDATLAKLSLRPMNFTATDSVAAVVRSAEAALQEQLFSHIEQAA